MSTEKRSVSSHTCTSCDPVPPSRITIVHAITRTITHTHTHHNTDARSQILISADFIREAHLSSAHSRGLYLDSKAMNALQRHWIITQHYSLLCEVLVTGWGPCKNQPLMLMRLNQCNAAKPGLAKWHSSSLCDNSLCSDWNSIIIFFMIYSDC